MNCLGLALVEPVGCSDQKAGVGLVVAEFV